MDSLEFSQRVRALRDPLWRIAYAILRNGADCDDALQEALLRAWRGIGGLKNEAFFETWLTRILINECNRIAAAPARRVQAMPENLPEAVACDHAELREAVFALPKALRVPLVLKYTEGYSLHEIAEMLDLPGTTVAWRLRSAKARLRDELSGEEHKS